MAVRKARSRLDEDFTAKVVQQAFAEVIINGSLTPLAVPHPQANCDLAPVLRNKVW